MKKILEVVNQVQDEERRLDSEGGSEMLSSARGTRSALPPPETSGEGSSLLGGLLGFVPACRAWLPAPVSLLGVLPPSQPVSALVLVN